MIYSFRNCFWDTDLSVPFLWQDKLATFLEIKKKELEQARVELRIKDRSLEEMEERHQDEIKVIGENNQIVYMCGCIPVAFLI